MSTQPTSPLQVVVIGAGTGGLCLAHGLERSGISVADGGDPCPVVRGSGTSGHRVVVGDEHDVTGRRRPGDPRVDVMHACYRGGPPFRPRRRCLLHGGVQPEILQLPDQVVANLGVLRRANRMWPPGDLLDVGEGPLRRELAGRSFSSGATFRALGHSVKEPIVMAGARHRGNHPSLGNEMGRRSACNVGKRIGL